MSIIDQLKEQLEKRVASWNSQLDAAEARARAEKARAEAEASSAEIRQELLENVQELRTKVSEAQACLDELSKEGEKRVDDIKARLRKLLE